MKTKSIYEVTYVSPSTIRKGFYGEKRIVKFTSLQKTMGHLMALGIICLNKSVDPYEIEAKITIDGKPCLPVEWIRDPAWEGYHPLFHWTEPVGDKTVTHWKTYTKITKKELLK